MDLLKSNFKKPLVIIPRSIPLEVQHGPLFWKNPDGQTRSFGIYSPTDKWTFTKDFNLYILCVVNSYTKSLPGENRIVYKKYIYTHSQHWSQRLMGNFTKTKKRGLKTISTYIRFIILFPFVFLKIEKNKN